MSNMDNITNFDLDDETSVKAAEKEFKKLLKQLSKLSKQTQIPFFCAYYVPNHEYHYSAILPEEIGFEIRLHNAELQKKNAELPEDKQVPLQPIDESILQQYKRFDQFLRVCLDFNAEDHDMPRIQKNKSKQDITVADDTE